MRRNVRAVAAQLDEEPALGTRLKGRLVGNRSINVGRSHRLVYSVEDSGVLVKTIRGRKDLYR